MLELLLKRRSIRNFKEQEVEKNKIDYIVKCCLLSPSSRNHCPWEFIVVTDKEKIIKLADSKVHGSAFVESAPLVIAVLGDPHKSDVWVEDTAIASIITQLSAESLGLGSCWVQIRKRMHNQEESSEDWVKDVLEIPDSKTVESLIAIGYPNEKRDPHTENDFDYKKVFSGEYNKSYK